jgi:putative cell wall-binding protein
MRIVWASHVSRRTLAMLVTIAVMLAVAPVAPLAAYAAQDDDIPGVPICGSLTDSVYSATDRYDVYRVHLLTGERLNFTMTELTPGLSDIDVLVYSTASTSIVGGTILGGAATGSNPEVFSFTAPNDGWFYVVVEAWPGSPPGGGYTLQFTRDWATGAQPPATPMRIWGAPYPTDTRYTVALNLMSANFPGWLNCDHIIICSGEDRAAADPLAASGLTWAYGAPILLVHGDRAPQDVINAINAVSIVNGGVTVHVVGGPTSVSDALLADLVARVPGVTIDRIAPHNDRFVLAASIARRMEAERPGGFHRTGGWGKIALVANGADYDKFFDALALSPLAARTGYPILLVEEDRIPTATQSVLNDLGVTLRVVGGGDDTVSNGVLNDLAVGASSLRWQGPDRYSTAVEIASQAGSGPTPPWTSPHNVAVTAKLPDALAGGVFVGLRGSPIVLTQTDVLPGTTRSYLRSHRTGIGECYVIGGPDSVTPGATMQIGNALVP